MYKNMRNKATEAEITINKTIFLILLIPLSHLIVNFFWDPYHEPLARNLRIDHVINWIFTILYFGYFIAIMFFSEIRVNYRILLTLVFFLFSCKVSVSVYEGAEEHLASVSYKGYNYHLTTEHYIGDSWDVYKLYKCDIFGRYCIPIESVIGQGRANQDVLKLVIETNLKEVHVYKFDELIFKYDPYHNW